MKLVISLAAALAYVPVFLAVQSVGAVGVVNDSRVRVRAVPNLNAAALGDGQ